MQADGRRGHLDVSSQAEEVINTLPVWGTVGDPHSRPVRIGAGQ